MYQKEKSNLYRAGIYLRLSREDGDKIESNSVQNQRDLIHSYLRDKKDITVVSEKIDDGYSGVTFDRPAFRVLLEEVKNGTVNCVIVKDLSRFGRNYIEAGKYIEQIFPFLGVRFIAINDNIDTAKENTYTDSILVPFKNLLNDAYSRDISIKVRSQLEMRQKRGDFVGAFPVYGYFRSQEDKHKLQIDESAAETVKKIFTLRIDGYNNLYIAQYLNRLGVPSPMEYKELQDDRYFTSFKLNAKAKWSPMAVDRILKNEMYTGIMLQGKETTFNYKLKKRIRKSSEEWIRIGNTHDAIIPQEDFEIVQQIMLNDTRTSPKRERLYLLSGMLRCGGCGSNMVRKTVKARGNLYTYYICSRNKENKKECASHRIRESVIEEALFALLQKHEAIFFQQPEEGSETDHFSKDYAKMKKIEEQINFKKDELKKYESLKNYLYEDYREDILTKTEYFEMRERYKKICMEIVGNIDILEQEKKEFLTNYFTDENSLHKPFESKIFTELGRSVLVLLVEKILILDGKTIKIVLRYQDEFGGNNSEP